LCGCVGVGGVVVVCGVGGGVCWLVGWGWLVGGGVWGGVGGLGQLRCAY